MHQSQEDRNSEQKKKLVIIGDSFCGKSSLLSAFALNQFPKEYVPTILEKFVVRCQIDRRSIGLSLWDTSGQEDHEQLRPMIYDKANVFLVVFDLSRLESLENAKNKWIEDAKMCRPGVPIILVGLKKDTVGGLLGAKEMHEEIIEYFGPKNENDAEAQVGIHHYMECSSLTGEGVDDVFECAFRATLPRVSKQYPTCCVIS